MSRPLFDRYRVSREKLAYLIDATSAPVCVMIPLNAWGAFIISLVASTGIENPLQTFIAAVPLNLYAIAAILLAGLVIPPAAREAGPRVAGAVAAFIEELREGWHFLRGEVALFQNTLVSVLAQLSIGATLSLMVVYAERTLSGEIIPYPESYAVIEAAIGVGNLAGGFVVGAIGARLRKGWLVITGFAVMGMATIVLGLTSNEVLAVGAAAPDGVGGAAALGPAVVLFEPAGCSVPPQAVRARTVAVRAASTRRPFSSFASRTGTSRAGRSARPSTAPTAIWSRSAPGW